MSLRSPYDREILALALPALGALAAEPLYLLADTAMVGHLGTEELAALAIAGTLITGAFTLFNTGTPRVFADIDRERAEQLGVPVASVFATLGTYLGSTYINDFNFLGRTFRVTAQADAPYRDETSDIGRLRTRSASGAMVPLDSVLTLRDDSGPRWRHCLLGLREMPMDFEMNIMCYAPGAHFWCIETHVMEHGMVMLQGQALQLLGRDWHELWEGDFVWMGPYVPQQIYATGSETCEYLLYKDVNRDVL